MNTPTDDTTSTPMAVVYSGEDYRLSLLRKPKNDTFYLHAELQMPSGSRTFFPQLVKATLETDNGERFNLGCSQDTLEACQEFGDVVWEPDNVQSMLLELDPQFMPTAKLYRLTTAQTLTVSYSDALEHEHVVTFDVANSPEIVPKVTRYGLSGSFEEAQERSKFLSDWYRLSLSCSFWDSQVKYGESEASDHPIPGCEPIIHGCKESAGRDYDTFRACFTTLAKRQWPTNKELSTAFGLIPEE